MGEQIVAGMPAPQLNKQVNELGVPPVSDWQLRPEPQVQSELHGWSAPPQLEPPVEPPLPPPISPPKSPPRSPPLVEPAPAPAPAPAPPTHRQLVTSQVWSELQVEQMLQVPVVEPAPAPPVVLPPVVVGVPVVLPPVVLAVDPCLQMWLVVSQVWPLGMLQQPVCGGEHSASATQPS